jgi:pimeloyl-ACP methyl ester carboxylesterase
MSAALAGLLTPIEGRLCNAGEIALYVVEEGHGRPIVFLHGLGWQHGLWRPQLARYGSRYRVLAGDNRGHGRSDRPPGPYHIRGMAEDWLRVLDGLELNEWAIVGFSQGGMIAQWIAVLAPERTKALAVIGASCKSNPVIRDAMEQRLTAAQESARAAADVAGRSIFSPGFVAREPEFFASFVSDRSAMPLGSLAAATRALYDFDVSSELSKIACPALVAVGAEDRLVPSASARELANLIPGVKFAIIPDAGHMVTIEQPAAFNALLDDFLANHYPPVASRTSGAPR